MRYIPHTSEEIQEMLKVIGLRSMDELFASIPESFHLNRPLKLPDPLDEAALLDHLHELAQTNQTVKPNRSFLGGGVYRRFIPSAVKDLIRRSEFLTPYTPYQPEIAQGTLQVMFEFQTYVSEIFGMEVANASLYDGSTALAEAALMAIRLQKKKTICAPRSLHPQYAEVTRTVLKNMGANYVEIPTTAQGTIDLAALKDFLTDDLAALVIPYPNFFGIVEDPRALVAMIHAHNALAIFCVPEPLSLGLFEAPGNFDADIVCGEGQSLGLFPSFSGPYCGFFATRKKFVRQMPGRVCGMTTDSKGRRGYVLTLSTREQHIRREKATSNICTNQGLCATQITIYLSLLGKIGLQKLAKLNWQRADYLKEKISLLPNVKLAFPQATTFNEFVIRLPLAAELILQGLRQEGFDGGIALDHWYPEMGNPLLVNCTEMNRKEDIDAFVEALKKTL